MYRSLQAGRAVAAALVVLFHLGGSFAQDRYFGFKALDGPFAWGDAGVDFFFVLSGFLITITHWRDFGRPQALGRYVFKRTARIYPTYWLVCLAVCLAALAAPSLRSALPADAATLLQALALVPQDPAVVGGTGSPILFVAWSLQYELLFYAVIGAFIVSRVAGMLIVATLATLYLGCQFGSECGFGRSFLASNLIFLFAMGVACACVVRSRFRLPLPLPVASAAAILFVVFGLFQVAHPGYFEFIDKRLVFGALSSVIVVALAQAEDSKELVLKQRWIVLLGDSSYSLYLLHIPLISLMCKAVLYLGISSQGGLVVSFVAMFVACIAIAAVFYLAIERRMLAFFRFERWVPRRAHAPLDTLVAGTSTPRSADQHFAPSR